MMFKELFIEAKHKDGEVQTKDWDRMMDLVLAGKDGAGTAKAIKDKNKAIARYIAGSLLMYNGETPKMDWNEFEAFGRKALELGATEEELQSIISKTKIPTKTADKYKSLKNKKLDNRFVGAISKAIIKMGFDIEFLPHNGNAITSEGRYAMERNGRKWTIGYKTEITTPSGEKVSFIFDAITDEGDGTTYYVIDTLKNLDTGEAYSSYDDVVGQREFLSILKNELSKYQ